jgi:hypothetical protein
MFFTCYDLKYIGESELHIRINRTFRNKGSLSVSEQALSLNELLTKSPQFNPL